MITIDEEVAKTRIAKRMAKEFQSEDDQFTIETVLSDKEKEARKGEVKVKVKPSIDAIKSRPRKDVSVDDILGAVND